ncbi:MAG: hypothetical protein J0I21_11705 [Alphaproteobacteria bacterium]|nr:hypothetical protein [Alphaproteobacteria bacterium]
MIAPNRRRDPRVDLVLLTALAEDASVRPSTREAARRALTRLRAHVTRQRVRAIAAELPAEVLDELLEPECP